MDPSTASPPWSLRLRVVLAVVLLVGFYALALGMAALLLAIPWFEMQSTGRVHVRIALFCVLGASVILFAAYPRRERFEPPGPRLDPEDQPRLFREIESVAEGTDQAMPHDVYLVADVNAFVTEHARASGLGKRRVMGIGLPLLQTLTVAQLRAVLAHEFGHFHGGDT